VQGVQQLDELLFLQARVQPDVGTQSCQMKQPYFQSHNVKLSQRELQKCGNKFETLSIPITPNTCVDVLLKGAMLAVNGKEWKNCQDNEKTVEAFFSLSPAKIRFYVRTSIHAYIHVYMYVHT
jgi:hypothetical protein